MFCDVRLKAMEKLVVTSQKCPTTQVLYDDENESHVI